MKKNTYRTQIIALVVLIIMGILVFLLARVGNFSQQKPLSSYAEAAALEVRVIDGEPPVVEAIVRGTLSDCSTLLGIDQSRIDGTIALDLRLGIEDNCATTETTFEKTILLDIGGLSKGTYRVAIGNHLESFVLVRDVVLLDMKTITDETFKKYPSESVRSASGSMISFADLDPVFEENFKNTKSYPAYSGAYAVLSVPCGEACFSHAVVNLNTGVVVKTFNSTYGVWFMENSRLLVVNPLSKIPASTVGPVAVEAYLLDESRDVMTFAGQGDYYFGELHEHIAE